MSESSPDPDSHEPFIRALAKYERIVRAYIRGSGISRPEDVDEIMQNVSMVAWEKFDKLHNIEEFPKWACVIARYEILNFRRAHARDRLVLNEKVFDLLLEESLEETSLNEQRLNCLQHCLNQLPDASRKLVLAAYQPGSTIDQMATDSGKKANTLYQQLWRLRRILEQCVEETLMNETESPEPG